MYCIVGNLDKLLFFHLWVENNTLINYLHKINFVEYCIRKNFWSKNWKVFWPILIFFNILRYIKCLLHDGVFLVCSLRNRIPFSISSRRLSDTISRLISSKKSYIVKCIFTFQFENNCLIFITKVVITKQARCIISKILLKITWIPK